MSETDKALKVTKRKRSVNWETIVFVAIFVVPVFVRIFISSYVMSFQSILYSFFDYNYSDPPGVFVGLNNYKVLFASELFWKQITNTIALFAMSMIGFFVPIIQALLLNEITRGHKVLRYLYVLPCGLPAMAGYSVWSYIWNPDAGIANSIVSIFGISPQKWLYDPALIKWCLTVPSLLGGGMAVLTYLVVIQGINQEIYDAAKVDGATDFQMMMKITIPNIMYYVSLTFVLSLTGLFSAFDGPYVMTNGTGGPEHSAETAVMGIYNRAYDLMQYGRAMAMSVLIVLFTLVFIILGQIAKNKLGKSEY